MSEACADIPVGVPEVTKPQPFIKWVGGKRQLLNALTSRLPDEYAQYHEPFLGGGAMFFAIQPKQAFLSDLNPQLIESYQVVRNHTEELIKSLSKHIYDREYYYHMRSMDRDESFASLSPVERVSRFIYLNKTCFNGLYRVNKNGHFNVPFGKYTNPRIVNPELLYSCARALKHVSLTCSSYRSLYDKTRPGDFVYFDPPYAPLSATSNFTGYQEDGFLEKDQIELRKLCTELDTKGVKWMLSNSTAPIILELYSQYQIELIPAIRAVNSKGSRRGAVNECLIRNYR